jgi:hypothetical protein
MTIAADAGFVADLISIVMEHVYALPAWLSAVVNVQISQSTIIIVELVEAFVLAIRNV